MKEIYHLYYQELVYQGLKIIKDKATVQDIVGDVFIKFFDHKYDIKDARHILYRMVQNGCIDYLRMLARHNRIEARLPQEEFIELDIIESEVLKSLSAAVSELPDESKKVIELYYLEEKTCVEISGILNKPAATIRSIKRYALGILFKTMQLK